MPGAHQKPCHLHRCCCCSSSLLRVSTSFSGLCWSSPLLMVHSLIRVPNSSRATLVEDPLFFCASPIECSTSQIPENPSRDRVLQSIHQLSPPPPAQALSATSKLNLSPPIFQIPIMTESDKKFGSPPRGKVNLLPGASLPLG